MCVCVCVCVRARVCVCGCGRACFFVRFWVQVECGCECVRVFVSG